MLALVLAACGGGGKKPANAGSAAIYAKKLAVSWGIHANGTASEDVFLQTTDDTGKQTSYPLGTFDGVCRVITPAPIEKAVTGIACAHVELDAVVEGDRITVLKGATEDERPPDPMAREQVLSVDAPPGAKVVVGA